MPNFNFSRLVRFKDPAGTIYYGEFGNQAASVDGLIGGSVPVYKGGAPWDDEFELTEKRAEIAEVRSRP
jgi:hypothetical protein